MKADLMDQPDDPPTGLSCGGSEHSHIPSDVVNMDRQKYCNGLVYILILSLFS